MLAAPVLLTLSCSVLCLIDLRDADEPTENVLLDMLSKLAEACTTKQGLGLAR